MTRSNQSTAQAETLPQLEFDEELLHGYYVQVPSAFMRSPKFSATAKVLYGVLLSYAGQRCVAWPGQETLCEAVGVSPKTLRNAIAELEASGLVIPKRNGAGKTMRYVIRKWESSTQETPKQRGNFSPSEMQNGKFSLCRTGKFPYELDSGEIDTLSGGNTRACVREKQPVKEPKAAAAKSVLKSDLPVSTGRKRYSDLPEGVPLAQLEPEVLERASPEKLLARFDIEFPKHRKCIEDIARRSDVRFPRCVQAEEARALIAKARRELQKAQLPMPASRAMIQPPADWLERYGPSSQPTVVLPRSRGIS
jgi:hypothetical protein